MKARRGLLFRCHWLLWLPCGLQGPRVVGYPQQVLDTGAELLRQTHGQPGADVLAAALLDESNVAFMNPEPPAELSLGYTPPLAQLANSQRDYCWPVCLCRCSHKSNCTRQSCREQGRFDWVVPTVVGYRWRIFGGQC